MRVFIGSSTEAISIMEKIAVLLEDIDFVVKCWKDNESFILGKTISENLSNILNEVDAAIFIYAEDDKTWYKDRVVGSPRDNVLFEHGFFAGKLGLNKSIIIRYEEPKMPSDLESIIYAEYKETKLNTLKEKLKLWKNDIEKSNDINTSTQNNSIQIPINNPIITSKFIELVNIKQGTYNRLKDNQKITMKNPFSISKKIITQFIYSSIMGYNPSFFKGTDLPMENVTFIDAITFCNKLSVMEGYQEVYTINSDKISCNQNVAGYRLPFEIEWEYALGYSREDIQENLDSLAWYNNNSGNITHEVGKKNENNFGIYDLLGNVWEWCFDSKDNSKLRVLRGGSFADYRVQFITQGFRKEKNENSKSKDVGFRIILQNHINN
jgi:hypothetical protein